MQVGLNALSQGTRTVFSSFPLDTEMFCFVTVLESTASPSKQLFQTGHSLPQFRSCRWDLLCCRKRAGASWGPSRPLLSPQKVLKVLLAKMTRCQVRSPLQRGDRGWPVATRIPQTPVPHLAVCVSCSPSSSSFPPTWKLFMLSTHKTKLSTLLRLYKCSLNKNKHQHRSHFTSCAEGTCELLQGDSQNPPGGYSWDTESTVTPLIQQTNNSLWYMCT